MYFSKLHSPIDQWETIIINSQTIVLIEIILLKIDFRKCLKINCYQFQDDMYTVFTPGGKDVLGIERESQILALFDSMGNGVVLDEDGTTRYVNKKKKNLQRMFNYCRGSTRSAIQYSNYFCRLSYNQIGGIFTDNPAGLPLVWTWNVNPKESISQTVYTVSVNVY